MYKKIISILILMCILVTFSACGNVSTVSSNKTDDKKESQGKIQVVVSFNAMREFVEAVGKDKVEVKTMIPNGTEPHDFEPKAKDLEGLNKAKVFVYSGFGMESWVDKSLKVVDNKQLVTVEASKGFESIKNTDEDEIKEHGQEDPHVWLSLKGAEFEAKNVKEALIKVDPSNKDYYEKNYKDFSTQLDSLYNDYKKKFDTAVNKNFVTGHAAFAYLCRDFGLKQNSVEDVFAEGEPTTKKMEELISYCKQNKIKTIFVEDMVSPKVSETLAKEVGAKVQKIYTLESKEDNKDYIQSMKSNLELIYNTLK
ncbi:ABC transporter substrate-binding protein [Clostridium carboxidivorans P7]|uniref:Periplasmic solute binding protein n=1 Tax=Clostridium carboxidivorans P7 TaxID=536227 RepID=C6PXA6_9CLOT|nr:metal ABC transporter substrate-binding protein [Clostridium carboxidivorans]AKN31569.1 ABC transporter substrate-binding protein [Clostridium carboxidivorans P7]EET86095.1 periplasmic solute binding protein [Clostridium carboxidivorans P7]EFG87021.1 periplasmic solute binding family protein [Clostridium carboxidivorans P7]